MNCQQSEVLSQNLKGNQQNIKILKIEGQKGDPNPGFYV
jgi:hypothetical protein